MSIPNWYSLALLGLAAWRSFQLLAFDEILDRPRYWLLNLPRGWQEGDDLPDDYRLGLAKFITCPYCAGAWVSALWWGAWQLWPHATLVVASVFALMTIPIAGHKLLAREEDK